MTGRPGRPARVVRVRISGPTEAVGLIADLIADYDGDGIEVLDRSAPRPNRRLPGARVYLILRVTEGGRP